jgi:FtsP/CotA-like multicopper oxidase with cupredoxin domain
MHHQRCRTTRSNLPLLLVCFAIIFSTAAGQVSRADGAASGFANPPMLSSHDGQLHVDLTAARAIYTIRGHQFQGMLYNGSYVPMVWRLHAGDSLTVTLHNHLNEPTNLHFHGLDISPLGNGDNVFLHIQPGSDFTYHITIPQKHVGLFGFHPHLHGDVEHQIIWRDVRGHHY